MSPDYSKSKVYKIECLLDPDFPVYIGATTRSLAERFAQHKVHYKQWKEEKKNWTSSFELFEKYGLEDCVITLLEECPCENKEQLNVFERKWIRNLNCVNKRQPGRTKKEYQEANKEKIAEHKKKYREENKEKIAEYQKVYREENKEK